MDGIITKAPFGRKNVQERILQTDLNLYTKRSIIVVDGKGVTSWYKS